MLGIRLEPEIEYRLNAVAAESGRSQSLFVREAILEKIEDYEDYAAAVAVLNNPGRRWTMEEVERELGLED